MRGLPRAFWVIVAVVFISYVGLGVILPVRVLYALEVGLSFFEIGLMASTFFLSQFIFQIPAGYLADRFGRRQTILGSLILHGTVAGLYLTTDSSAVFIALRVIEGAGSAAFHPSVRALIVDLVPEGQRGRAFGIYRASFQTSLLAGPALGGLLAAAAGYQPTYLVAVAARVLAVLLVVLFLRVGQRVAAPLQTAHSGPGGRRLRLAAWGSLFTPPLVAAYIVSAGTVLSHSLENSIWSIYLQDLGAPLSFIGLTFTLRAAVAALATPWAGALADRGSRGLMTLGSGLLQVATAVALAFVPHLPVILGVVFVQGLATALMLPAIDRYVADASPPERRTQVQALFNATAVGAAGLFALVVSPLYEAGAAQPFLALAACELLTLGGGALLMLAVARREQRQPPVPSPASVDVP